jgi:hypothetical protein
VDWNAGVLFTATAENSVYSASKLKFPLPEVSGRDMTPPTTSFN